MKWKLQENKEHRASADLKLLSAEMNKINLCQDGSKKKKKKKGEKMNMAGEWLGKNECYKHLFTSKLIKSRWNGKFQNQYQKKKAFKYPIINKKTEMMIKNFPPQRLVAQTALQEVLLNFQKKRSKFQGIVNFYLIPTTQKSRKRAHFMR